MKELRVKRSEHGDQYFAVYNQQDRFIIVKVFYNVDKCEDYVYEHNNRIKL